MISLSIPDRYRPGLSVLLDADQSAVNSLLSALRDVEPALSSEKLSSAIGGRIPGLSETQAADVVEFLLSMCALRAHLEATAESVARALVRAIEEANDKSLKFVAKTGDEFSEQLAALLNVEPLSTASRAIDLLVDRTNLFQSIRILTDIRPVFGSGVEQPPDGVLIVHTLKLMYRDGEDVREFFVSIDQSDIGKIRDALDRADLKAEQLRSILLNTGVTFLDFT
jgi:hypothetical protein